MNFKLITEPLDAHLHKILDGAKSFKCAVAYLNYAGLTTIEKDVEDILKRSGNIHLIHGLEPSVTEPDTVRTLVEMKKQNDSMQYHVLMSQAINLNLENIERLFHPKIYLVNTIQGMSYCVVGSSNLTLGGLQKNIEINALISGKINEPELDQCERAFKKIEGRPDLITPNDEFCSIYDQIYEKYQILDKEITRDSGIQNLIDQLQSTQEYTWKLRNQIDFVTVAIFELQNEGYEYVHLRDIYERGKSLASEHGKNYAWETWHDSVRSCLNRNVYGKGNNLFLRRETDSRSGYYCLSDKGEDYVLNCRKLI